MTMRPDRRLHRANVLAALVWQTIGKYICQHDEDADLLAHDALLRALYDTGADFVTDADRVEYGLPPRGPDGWTAEELKALELKRLEAMLSCGVRTSRQAP